MQKTHLDNLPSFPHFLGTEGLTCTKSIDTRSSSCITCGLKRKNIKYSRFFLVDGCKARTSKTFHQARQFHRLRPLLQCHWQNPASWNNLDFRIEKTKFCSLLRKLPNLCLFSFCAKLQSIHKTSQRTDRQTTWASSLPHPSSHTGFSSMYTLP